MNDTQRVTPWGTITCGLLAVITAGLVGLVHLGGVSVPFSTLGPGAVISLGVIVLLTGLFVVLRSNAREHKARVTAPAPPAIDRPGAPAGVPQAPTSMPAELAAAQAVLDEPVLGEPVLGQPVLGQPTETPLTSPLPTSTLDVIAPEPTTPTPVAQGAAESSSPTRPDTSEEHGESQSSH